MLLFTCWCLLVHAVSPPPAGGWGLVGQWQAQRVAFEAHRVLTAGEQESLNDSTTAALNEQLRRGHTRILLTCAPLGRYAYRQTSRADAPPLVAAGQFRVSRDSLYLLPPPAALPGAVRVARLGRRVLVLEFAVPALGPGICQLVTFRRQPAGHW